MAYGIAAVGVLLCVAGLGAACDAPEGLNGTASSRSDVDSVAEGIVIELREGYDGEDRAWWCADARQAGTSNGRGVIPASDVTGAMRRCDAYFAYCREASERAYDVLVADGVPSWLEAPQYARKWLTIVPNASISCAVVMSFSGHCDGVFDLVSQRFMPDPEQVIDRVRETATWSGDGSRIAFHTIVDRRLELGHRIIVLDAQSGHVLQETDLDHPVNDIAWSPDGSMLAVLCSHELMGQGLLDRLSESIGHGVPYADFVLVTIDLVTGESREYAVEDDVKYGDGFVVWDGRAVRCMVR